MADAAIWQHAANTGAIIVSKDEDFAHLTLTRPKPVAVVWLRFRNCRSQVLLAKMERVCPEIVRQLEDGARQVEVQ